MVSPTTDSIADFELDQRRRGLALRTIRTRTLKLASFAGFLGTVRLEEATRTDVQDWLDSCNIGPRSRYAYLSDLSAYYQYLMREGARGDDPTAMILRPKTGRLLPHPIGSEDLDLALRHADDRMRCWLMLGAFQGLRSSEMAALRREDIMESVEPPLLMVRQGKGGKDRALPLNENVEMALHAFGLPRSGWVFRMPSGRPYAPTTLSSYIARYLHGLNINHTSHSLRHAFGTRLYAVTRDIRIVQEMLGHADPGTTAIYVQMDATTAADAVRHLGMRSTHPANLKRDV